MRILGMSPNTQFKMNCQALMMIKEVFAENGIKIAVPTVPVEGGGDRAAAAQPEVNALKPVPEAAAGQGAAYRLLHLGH